MNSTGIILAGGRSTRMGTDKGLIDFMGKPMIEHVIDNMVPLCNEIIISANNKLYERFGYPVVTDKITGIGPVSGMVAGMEQASNTNCLIVSCDLPLASSRLLRILIEHSSEHEITVPQAGNFVQPLCGLYKKSILNAVIKFIQDGNYGLRYLIREFNTLILEQKAFGPVEISKELINFNTLSEIVSYKGKE